MSLSEIREAEAPADVAALYADIKASAALPQVNLIFRHLATRPLVLPWVWSALRPLYRSAALREAARALHLSIARDAPSPLAGLPAADLARIAPVLAAYNSGNPQNLIALTALVRALARPPATPPSGAVFEEAAATPGGAVAAAFPALPRTLDLDGRTHGLVMSLASRHGDAGRGVVPSLYLHLALWPEAVQRVHDAMIPLLDADDWPARVEAVTARADAAAAAFAPALAFPEPAPPAADVAAARDVVASFIATTIPEMIVIGRLLSVEPA